VLDEYEQKLGLPQHSPPGTEQELEIYLNQDRTEIECLDATQCASLNYRLNQYAFYLQRCINLERCRFQWANAHLKETVAPQLQNYDKYMKYEVKVSLICKENSYAKKLQDIINHTEQRITRLDSLSYNLQALSKTLSDLQRAKISERYTEK